MTALLALALLAQANSHGAAIERLYEVLARNGFVVGQKFESGRNVTLDGINAKFFVYGRDEGLGINATIAFQSPVLVDRKKLAAWGKDRKDFPPAKTRLDGVTVIEKHAILPTSLTDEDLITTIRGLWEPTQSLLSEVLPPNSYPAPEGHGFGKLLVGEDHVIYEINDQDLELLKHLWKWDKEGGIGRQLFPRMLWAVWPVIDGYSLLFARPLRVKEGFQVTHAPPNRKFGDLWSKNPPTIEGVKVLAMPGYGVQLSTEVDVTTGKTLKDIRAELEGFARKLAELYKKHPTLKSEE